MIELSENFITNNHNALIDNIDGEIIKQAAKEQPNFRSFYLSYGQEGHLNEILDFYFDSVRKPTQETVGTETSADSICFKDNKEFRSQLKQITSESIREMNNIKHGVVKHITDNRLIRSMIKCNPNHSKPFYKRNELDVMVADVSPLHGVPIFLYKLIDDFESPSKKQKKSAINNPEKNFSIHEDIEEYIEPTNKIIFNPAGFYENGWTENLNEIMSKLFSNNYNLRSYNTNAREQIIKAKDSSTLINYL